MSILDTFSSWLEPPSIEYYWCSSCGSRFKNEQPTCPDCGGEIEPIDGAETAAYYWYEI